MRYPNSITSASAGAALSAPKPSPLPRPKPPARPPAPPRRKPGRPQPARPRRKPNAPARPAPGPRPPPFSPGGPGRKPDRTPGLPYKNAPSIKRLPLVNRPGLRFPLYDAFMLGFNMTQDFLWDNPQWQLGDKGFAQPEKVEEKFLMGGGWRLWSKDMNGYDPPPGYTHMGWTIPNSQVPNGLPWSGAPYNYGIGNQAGYHATSSFDRTQKFDWNQAYLQGRNWMMFVDVWSDNPSNPNADRGWFWQCFGRNPTNPTNAPGQFIHFDPSYKFWPSSGFVMPNLNWHNMHIPMIQPILPAPNITPAHPPVYNPVKRPQPWTEEFPDVGPHPAPKPKPEPAPQETPVAPTPIGEIPLPQPSTQPSTTEIVPGKPPVTQPGPTRPPRPPGPREKERKAKMTPGLGAIWYGVGTITEVIDFINSVYEALPKDLKVAWYLKHGRQPNPAEKALLIYQNINSVNIVQALTNYTQNQIEDMLYAAGGQQLAQANQKDNRPIGYSAGGALTGSGEFIFIR